MLSRRDLRMLATAARRGYDTPVDRRRKAVQDVQDVLNSAEAGERLVETARATKNVLEEAGWVAAAENVVQ